MKQINKPIHIQGNCPVCGSNDLIHNQPSFNGISMNIEYRCISCDNYGQQNYSIKFQGTNIVNDDFSETFVNVGDEIIGSETK